MTDIKAYAYRPDPYPSAERFCQFCCFLFLPFVYHFYGCLSSPKPKTGAEQCWSIFLLLFLFLPLQITVRVRNQYYIRREEICTIFTTTSHHQFQNHRNSDTPFGFVLVHARARAQSRQTLSVHHHKRDRNKVEGQNSTIHTPYPIYDPFCCCTVVRVFNTEQLQLARDEKRSRSRNRSRICDILLILGDARRLCTK